MSATWEIRQGDALELNPDYCELGRRRIRDDQPLFNAAAEAAA